MTLLQAGEPGGKSAAPFPRWPLTCGHEDAGAQGLNCFLLRCSPVTAARGQCLPAIATGRTAALPRGLFRQPWRCAAADCGLQGPVRAWGAAAASLPSSPVSPPPLPPPALRPLQRPQVTCASPQRPLRTGILLASYCAFAGAEGAT